MERGGGGVCVAGVEVGDVRGLSGIVCDVAGNGLEANKRVGVVRAVDAGDYGIGGMEVEDVDEW